MPLHHDFIRTAKNEKDRLAIVDRTTNRRVTYSKALIASLILARKLTNQEEGAIGIMIPTSAGAVLSILAALISGRVPVIINYSTGAAENAEYAQDKCGFKTIVTSKALLEKIDCRRVDGMIFIEDIMDSISTLDKLRGAAKSKLPTSLLLRTVGGGADTDTALVLFTSGSEKDPKAVELSHRNIASNISSLGQVFDLSNKDVFLASLPYFHIFGQTANLWLPLHFGMTIVTIANPLDFRAVVKAASDEGATLMVGTPTFFWGYLNKSNRGDFNAVRIALVGADKCPEALRQAWLEKHGFPLLEAYGATETSPAISANTLEDNRPGSVGKILPDVSVRVENIDTGAECDLGEVGKVLVKGDLVMKGYLNDLEETSLRIKVGWYDTGDMGFLDEDGYLWLSGRLRRFVKIGGEMVSLVRVENVLEAVLPPETSCCVVDLPDPKKGARIMAAVTRKLDHKKLIKEMAQELPNLALPQQFIYFEELPTMGSGKIDFRAVTQMVKLAVHSQTTDS